MSLIEVIRSELPELVIQTNCGGGSFKSQMKKADKSAAGIALLLGEDEILNNKITIKYLREQKEQQTIPQDEIVNFIRTSV